MECPDCNGSGHHNYKDCIKCDGTGEYIQTKIHQPNKNELSKLKIVLIWLGFFVLLPLLVYLIVFFKKIGIINEVFVIVLSAASWLIIYNSLRKIITNLERPKHERLLFVDPDKSLLGNVINLSIIAVLAVLIFLMAFSPALLLIR